MYATVVLMCSLVLVASSPDPSSSCRYWCRTPERQVYCCESGNQRPSQVRVPKPGRCPQNKIACPPVEYFRGPPQTCSNDGSCYGYDKCCYDRCLREHVCKPPYF
ncbi:antileukoproteinase-like [Oratosquilla oratoria]|uniref:antileukoproteinase-like n=1 Tax=Oratosquilla oratoria TaxID=337810 RepID=UPI003F769339